MKIKKLLAIIISLAAALLILTSCSFGSFVGDVFGNEVREQLNLPYLYNEFTPKEREFIEHRIGEVIPFIPTDEYYVEETYLEDSNGHSTLECVNYYTFGNTRADFDEYLDALSDYKQTDVSVEDGIAWYIYEKGDLVLEIAYYKADSYIGKDYVIDIYAYISESDLDDSTDDGNTENNGGDQNQTPGNNNPDNNDGEDNNDPNIPSTPTNPPDDPDAVYNIDFTKAKNVKDVTDQGYYLGGCPTTGSPGVLVIPVDFSDATASSKGYRTDVIADAFIGGDGDTDYYSVHDYYYISSYGQLDLDITVLDYWFRPQYSSSYYERQTMDYYGDDIDIGDQMIMDEALAYLEPRMDLSKFDSDGNGMIDAVVLITTLDIGDDDFHWAYRYWNLYTDRDDYYYEYDGVSANDYLWAPYQFLFESYEEESDYSDKSLMNTYTYIHEFGHVLGADDYYDTAYVSHPMDGYDMMDGMHGDHNPYTKFNMGWITESRLIVADGSTTITLENFARNGDTVIIANGWDAALGAYQEYYVLMYYTNEGLNSGVGGYFEEEGIVVYHVNAELYSETIDGETYYDIYNNNTHSSDEYGTEDNLIELVKSPDGDYVYEAGESLRTVYDDNGKAIPYTFTVESLSDTAATVIFTKR